ncbi:MAG: AAA family ATPase [Scytonematopsis contorta HA4267-MV1]|jgi:predicted ATPase/signal transduction histidine kinase/tRNA A-37 threonylcarbamoyl transferase component Bud32|nr:AAA family ATPase [Scytonematopsis contorta HA4267-MV1]
MVTSFSIPGYEITEIIHRGENAVICCRAKSQLEQRNVILKVVKEEYPSLDIIARLKHEYKIIQNLDLEGVVKLLRLETYGNRLALVFEDFGGKSLKNILSNNNKLEISSFLSIAIQVTKALVSVHAKHIIHKDIKPSNIIINPSTGVVKLTDFSIASRLSKEIPQLSNLNQLEGTLAYISPEQTGRMNRALDYRTDFYSLGVTFYELLTGQLPFQSENALELVYCHIAKQPQDIEQLNPEIKGVIVAIVYKLMAKNAEDRYQTAEGLLADLELCAKQLKTTGEIIDFIPGRLDILSQLLIPQKLYGRETQVNLLLEAFERVSQGNSELILVSGYSGIGKSSVVNEVNKPITRSSGFFINGKFDQFQRDIPYASLIQALSQLMRQLLTESSSKLQQWRENILAAVGANGQVIIDVIPEVELIIGKQPLLTQLIPTESQNRFNRVFCDFIRVFSKKEHPLVIFLDDLQWADSATLKLMQLLMSNPDSKYLLLIGAYRDNEVNTTHPLINTIEAIQESQVFVSNINLQPLALEDVKQVLLDTLKDNTQRIDSLGELIYNKTGGNPFFLTQILLALHQEKLLTFDYKTALWQWNIQEIQAVGITDKSIVELVAARINNLPESTQELLKLAACVGNRLSLDILSIISKESSATTANKLYPALQSGLILPLSENYIIPLAFNQEEFASFQYDSKKIGYKFLHDRVQQAAYSLIPEEHKQQTHLQIGKLIIDKTPPELLKENILDIVNQFNYGIKLLTNSSEKYDLAKLNLMAGNKAKLAAAYEASAKYLNIGLGLLVEESWNQDYQLSLNLHTEASEAEFLTGHFEISSHLVDVTLQRANNIFDKVRVYVIQMQIYMALNQMPKVLEIGLDFLDKLGVKLPKNPSKRNVSDALIEINSILDGKKIEDLVLLPEMTDSYKLAAMPILMFVTNAASQGGYALLFVLCVSTMVRLSVNYGNSPVSAFAYGVYGSILSDKFGDIETGYRFGQLAVDLVLKINDNSLKSKVFFIFNGMIRHLKDHLKDTNADLLEGMNSGLENGDIEFGSYCAAVRVLNLFFNGVNLDELDTQLLRYIDCTRKLKLEALVAGVSIFRETSLNLQARTSHITELLGESFDESKMMHLVENNVSYQGYYHFCKSFLYYLFSDYKSALPHAQKTAELHKINGGFVFFYINYFYYSLVIISNLAYVSDDEKKQYLKQVNLNQKIMKKLAIYAPANFKHQYELVEAEKARFLNKRSLAMDLYDSAIAEAKTNNYIQEEALANELAANFYLEIGKEKIAKIYMTDAYYGYIKWGAIAKVEDLDKRYPNLIIRCESIQQPETDLNKIITQTKTLFTKTTISSNDAFDLDTVIKASQAISSEIVLDKLLDKLLSIIIENTAAQKACLILSKGNELFIEGIKNEDNLSVVLQSVPVSQSQDVPISLVNYVARTQEILVMNNATYDTISKYDVYIEACQPKSVLCTPIFYQGKFIGVLYLENNITTGAFTSERVKILNLICAQAAISLENSQLYQQSQDYAKKLECFLHELQEMQLQLVQSEKMSALGNLVSGIGHEINNPIAFISGNLEPANEYVKDLFNIIDLYQKYYPIPEQEITKTIEKVDLDYVREDLPKLISSMQEGVNRIFNLSMSLRTFSRSDTEKVVLFDIHEGLNSTLLILKHRLKASSTRPAIEVVKNYGDLPKINCFPGQLNQVFMNLLANAIDALEEFNSQRSFAEIQANPNCIIVSTNCVNEENVVISIKDNGPGMSEQVKQNIFEHLFTTKAVGKGTGLGLAIARQIIVEKHKGSIDVISSPGEGAEFLISIPIDIYS